MDVTESDEYYIYPATDGSDQHCMTIINNLKLRSFQCNRSSKIAWMKK